MVELDKHAKQKARGMGKVLNEIGLGVWHGGCASGGCPRPAVTLSSKKAPEKRMRLIHGCA